MPSLRGVLTPSRLIALRGIGARVVSLVAATLLTLLVSRVLGRDGAGSWSVYFTALFTTATITRFGAENLALRLTAADPHLGRPLVRPALVVTAALGLAGAVVVAVIAGNLAGLEREPARWLLAAAAGSAVLPLNLVVLAGAWLRSLGGIALGALLELGAVPLLACLGLVGLAVAHAQSLPALVLIYAAVTWLVAAAAVALALRALPAAREPAVGVGAYLRRFGHSLAAYMLTGTGFYLVAYLAILVYGALGQEPAAADYKNAQTLANFVGLLPTMQISYLTPQFAHLFHAHRGEELHALVFRATGNAVAMGAVIALPMLIAPAWLMALYKAEFRHAWPVLVVLVVQQLLVVVCGPVYALLTTCDLEKVASRILLVALPATVVATVLAARLGPVAAAAAAGIAPVGFAVAGYVALLRLRGIPSAVWHPARPEAAAAVD